MKKLVLTLSSVALLATSCGVSTQAPKNDKDTAAYAIGVVIGQNAMMQLDSTIDYTILVEAVKDAYAKKSDKKLKEMQAYMMGAQIGGSARGVDSTFNIDVIAAGIADVFAKKQAIKTEEADGYIMGYISNKQKAESDTYLAKVDATEGVTKNESGLRYIISATGSEPLVGAQDTVLVNYTLYGTDEKVLDSSVARNEPFKTTMDQVVKGFAMGIQLLGKGGKATIWMPSDLGYGDRGNNSVAPGQPLKFDIEIVDVMPFKETATK